MNPTTPKGENFAQKHFYEQGNPRKTYFRNREKGLGQWNGKARCEG